MHTEGILSKWNESKGYGFITPQRGGQDVFVHISAFPQDGRRPVLREKLSFTIAIDANGKKRAIEVQRSTARQEPAKPPRKRPNTAAFLAASALLAATLFYGYTAFYAQQPEASSTAPATDAATPFHCDGRTQCSQMSSCEEARFFLRNCPNVQMDGNGDGVPCEQQWCGQ